VDKFLTDRLTQAGAIVAVVTFGLSYLTTNGVVTALGVVGIAWFAVGGLLFGQGLIRSWRDETASVLQFYLLLFCLTLVLYILVSQCVGHPASGSHFHSFSWLQVNGLAGIGLAALAGIALLQDRHQANFKRCPDCYEEIRRAARVCKFCGYRWAKPDDRGEIVDVVNGRRASEELRGVGDQLRD
jgi:hypothetical protein